MRIRQEWMSDSEYFGEDYPNNMLLDDAIRRFELQKQSSEGKDVLVDGITERIVVQNHTNPLNQAKYDKKLSFDIDSKVHTGSVIEFDDKKWIVISKIFDKQAYKVGSVLRCNNTLNFYDSTHTPHQIPCIVESNVRFQDLRLEENKFISQPDDKITIRIPYNDITKNIKRNQIFKLIDNDNYKVISVNKVTEPGLIILKLEYAIEQQESHTYSLTILNGDLINLQQSNTIQLNIQVKDDTTVLTPPPPYLFESFDENILTVDENGLITAISIGTTTVICKLQNDETVYDTINITVEEVPVPETYTLELTGNIQPDTEIKQSQVITYTCVKKNNLGVIIDDATFDFNIVAGTTPSSAYIFTVLNNTQCSIKCNKLNYYIDLVATDKLDSSLSISKHIILKAIF